MGFLDDALDGVTEPTTVPGGCEYRLRIIDVKTDGSYGDNLPRNKNDAAYLLPRFEIVGEPTTKDFTKYLGVPSPDMDAKKRNNSGYAIKTFLTAFNLDADSLHDPSEMIGAEGWAILGLEDSAEWGEQNFVKKFVAGK